MVIVNAYYSEKIKSKIVHISVNTSEVKYANNKTRNEESLDTDNSVINALIYLKIFECGKKIEQI